MQPVEWEDVSKGGRITCRDTAGGVFAPIPTQRITRPAWTYSPPAGKPIVMFTCPVSAIPAIAWDLFTLWSECKAMKIPPVAGGVLDQPVEVRRTFPIFEDEADSLDAATRATQNAESTAAAVGVMLRAMTGRST